MSDGSAGHWVSAECRGEICTRCGTPATHKIGEEDYSDAPPVETEYGPVYLPRHNLTSYLCCACFQACCGRCATRVEPPDAEWTTTVALDWVETVAACARAGSKQIWWVAGGPRTILAVARRLARLEVAPSIRPGEIGGVRSWEGAILLHAIHNRAESVLTYDGDADYQEALTGILDYARRALTLTYDTEGHGTTEEESE